MRVAVQTINFTAHTPLKEYVDKKIKKIGEYWDKITDVEVFLKNTNSNQKPKEVEIKVIVPGSVLIATEGGTSFEEAFDLCLDNIIRQIKRYKEKLREKR